jgi:hypothetical protein
MYRRVFIISKPANGKRKQNLKQNLYLLCLRCFPTDLKKNVKKNVDYSCRFLREVNVGRVKILDKFDTGNRGIGALRL